MDNHELLLAISDMIDKKLKAELEPIKTEIDNITRKVTAINMTLENEISHNIMVIAESHLDLSRKLDETIRISSDIKAKQEIQDIYINRHENKLKIKDIS